VKKEEKRKKVDINICKCQKMPPKIILAKGIYRVKVVRRSSVSKTVVGYPPPKKSFLRGTATLLFNIVEGKIK